MARLRKGQASTAGVRPLPSRDAERGATRRSHKSAHRTGRQRLFVLATSSPSAAATMSASP